MSSYLLGCRARQELFTAREFKGDGFSVEGKAFLVIGLVSYHLMP